MTPAPGGASPASGSPPKPGTTKAVHTKEQELLGRDLSALCLSGGGIRSAAFCLGSLQALAACRGASTGQDADQEPTGLLGQFSYLSTVSGGGFIGGWLTRCIAAHEGDVGKVEREVLAPKGPCVPTPGEPSELDRLRRYVNYLTPRSGWASNDTWAGITLWLRNTLINWAVFLPLLMAFVAAPLLYATMIGDAAVWPAWHAFSWACIGALGVLSLAVAIYNGCVGLPSHRHPDPPNQDRDKQPGLNGRQVRWQIIYPALAWAFLVPLAEAAWLKPSLPEHAWKALFVASQVPTQRAPGAVVVTKTVANEVKAPVGGTPASDALRGAATPGLPQHETRQSLWSFALPSRFWRLALIPMLSFAAAVLAYVIAWMRVRSYPYAENFQALHSRAFFVNAPAWLLSAALSATLLFVGGRLAIRAGALTLAIVGPVWVIGTELSRTVLYVALRREGLRSDLDREWLARLNGAKIRAVIVLAGLATAAIVLPRMILDHPDRIWTTIVGVIAFVAGPVGAFIGSSAKTALLPAAKAGAPGGLLRPEPIVEAAIVLFLACLLMLAGRLDVSIVRSLLPSTTPCEIACLKREYLDASALLLATGLLSLGIAFGFGQWTNLNRFSMHAVYRNRLVRAFLGTARPWNERRADRYTSFDPADDIRVSDSFTDRKPVPALYPVINVALNRTSGRDTARAERKAVPFVITPHYCGSSALAQREGRYMRTVDFAGGNKLSGPRDDRKGITLGTAMALSGAAVSPNRGYNSSPLTAFVMTLFNLRLGAWLPNPGAEDAWPRLVGCAGPVNAVPTMLNELTGASDDRGDFVYLSDGGHFDNLGLYEMLARRCRRIFVIDAGRDGDYGYATLGQVLERAKIDMGVAVDFVGPLRTGGAKLETQGAHALIRYACGDPGELILLKPWMPDDAPVELQAYKSENASFPHGSTLDQFFTESDFESYRHLGEYLTRRLIKDALAVEPPGAVTGKPRRSHRQCPLTPASQVRTPDLEMLFTGLKTMSGATEASPEVRPLLSAIRRRLDGQIAEPATEAALRSLWWAANGDFDRAHAFVNQHPGDPCCDLVHAHLHRRQGHAELARDWYYYAGRSYAFLPIAEEWSLLALELTR